MATWQQSAQTKRRYIGKFSCGERRHEGEGVKQERSRTSATGGLMPEQQRVERRNYLFALFRPRKGHAAVTGTRVFRNMSASPSGVPNISIPGDAFDVFEARQQSSEHDSQHGRGPSLSGALRRHPSEVCDGSTNQARGGRGVSRGPLSPRCTGSHLVAAALQRFHPQPKKPTKLNTTQNGKQGADSSEVMTPNRCSAPGPGAGLTAPSQWFLVSPQESLAYASCWRLQGN